MTLFMPYSRRHMIDKCTKRVNHDAYMMTHWQENVSPGCGRLNIRPWPSLQFPFSWHNVDTHIAFGLNFFKLCYLSYLASRHHFQIIDNVATSTELVLNSAVTSAKATFTCMYINALVPSSAPGAFVASGSISNQGKDQTEGYKTPLHHTLIMHAGAAVIALTALLLAIE